MLCSFAFAGCSPGNSEDDPDTSSQEMDEQTIVTVSGGQIGGYAEDNLYIYKGIPYMASPVGELRWQEPRPATSWEGVKACMEYGPDFYQAINAGGAAVSEEEGLTMNIWAPADLSTAKEVLVYIHGGALMAGRGSSPEYDGTQIAKEGVVYITFNYRLGNFSRFVSSELSELSDCGASGNYHIKDCVAALEWINENISAFGGDPEKITIMGQSAGAELCSLLCLSPKAEGLFQQAVILSGNLMAKNDFATLEEMEELGDELLNGRTIAEMREMSARQVYLETFPGLDFYCIDGVYITDNGAEMIQKGDWNGVNVMTGYTTGDISLIGGTIPATAEAYEQTVTETYNADVLALYPSDGVANHTAAYLDIYRDAQMAKLNYITKLLNDDGIDSDVYIWSFSHIAPDVERPEYGAPHGSDIPYFLNSLTEADKTEWTDADDSVLNVMHGYLMNFVKTGTPNGEDANGNALPAWEACDAQNRYMHLSESAAMSELETERAAYWDAYYADRRNLVIV